MKILNVVGARPNFMKVAPLHNAFQNDPSIDSKIVHTGQHFDSKMSDIFFEQLQLPKPDYFLGINGGSHTQQIAHIMLEFEKVVEIEQPDLIIVVGDVTSTIACALVAVKMNVKIAHVEAGLRSSDRKMPEEINRILTDSISDFLFVTEQAGMVNLAREGVPQEKVFFVGNCMIDSLVFYQKKMRTLNSIKGFNLSKGEYVLVTMHRPANVDTKRGLRNIIQIIENIGKYGKKVLFPIHPRTLNNAQKFGLADRLSAIKHLIVSEPQGYLEFLNLMENAALIVTDSGGIQEETTFLQIPCLTFRDTTERPVTVELGTNQLLSDLDPHTVDEKVAEILNGTIKMGVIPPFWDGKAAGRIVRILNEKLQVIVPTNTFSISKSLIKNQGMHLSSNNHLEKIA